MGLHRMTMICQRKSYLFFTGAFWKEIEDGKTVSSTGENIRIDISGTFKCKFTTKVSYFLGGNIYFSYN